MVKSLASQDAVAVAWEAQIQSNIEVTVPVSTNSFSRRTKALALVSMLAAAVTVGVIYCVSPGHTDSGSNLIQQQTKLSAKTTVACEGSQLTISCPTGSYISVVSALYGRKSSNICPGVTYSTQCASSTSLTAVRASCDGKSTCVVNAGNDVFGDPCYGTNKYLEVAHVCTSYTPLMTKIDAVACEGSNVDITCPSGSTISIVSASYGRTSTSVCPAAAMYSLNCAATRATIPVQDACDGKNHCTVAASNDVFGDPCWGTNKYLTVSYKCMPVQTSVACEGSTLSISCPKDSTITVTAATYGRTSSFVCPTDSSVNALSCKSTTSLSAVSSACNGKTSCSVDAVNGVFGDPCFGTNKYLEVSYTCSRTACEGSGMAITCPSGSVIAVSSAIYGRRQTDVCTTPAMYDLSCASDSATGYVHSTCDGKGSCSLVAGNDYYGDPCWGTNKYLKVAYQCVAVTRTVACESSDLSISCPRGTAIVIMSAAYGRTNTADCSSYGYPMLSVACSSASASSVVHKACDGKASCTVGANNGAFGDPCVGTFKYLETTHVCV